ncbi:MAG TPA: hypothetical protein DCZ94_19730 [Lentisphaeria bacterium]|nr:MAG: hypothetical protein A2X48_22430 [Lentisphaerae bacterium GWF2_49_21]HBC89176.1 hypothetical protein [Lentisphaeria bacterium]
MSNLYYFMLLTTTFALLLIVYIPFRKSQSIFFRGFVGLLCVIILSLVGYDIVRSIFATKEQGVQKKHKEYMQLAGEILGKQLRYAEVEDPRIKVLIIDFPEKSRIPRAGVSKSVISGLEKGLKAAGFSFKAIERVEPSKTNDYWLSANEFDRIIRKHPDVGIVISLVGLPKDLRSVEFWNDENPPRLVLFGGNLKNIDQALRYKVVVAAITFLPGANFWEKPNSDIKSQAQIFNEHFLYITAKNVDDINDEFPILFK